MSSLRLGLLISAAVCACADAGRPVDDTLDGAVADGASVSTTFDASAPDLGSADAGSPDVRGLHDVGVDGGLSEGDAGTQLESYLTRYPVAECALFNRCNLFNGCSSPSTGVELFFSRLRRGIAAGTLDFDPAAAEACLQSLGTVPCGTLIIFNEFSPTALIPDCGRVFTGKVALGGACSSIECQGDEESAFCDTIFGQCGGGTCRALAAAGAPCDPDATSSSTTACGARSGNYCNPRSRTCVPFTPDGQRCTIQEQCQLGHACLPSLTGDRCAVGPEHAAPGELCLGDYACTPPLRCVPDPTGTLPVCAIPLPVGSPCLAEYTKCADGSVCLDLDGALKCHAPSGIGGPCAADSGDGCASELYCDFLGHPPVCRAFALMGEPCGGDDPPYCNFGSSGQAALYCLDGHCAPTKGRGDACRADEECWDAEWVALCSEGHCWDYGQCI